MAKGRRAATGVGKRRLLRGAGAALRVLFFLLFLWLFSQGHFFAAQITLTFLGDARLPGRLSATNSTFRHFYHLPLRESIKFAGGDDGSLDYIRKNILFVATFLEIMAASERIGDFPGPSSLELHDFGTQGMAHEEAG
jgi:hypothetical protein